jgi:hypothetical protein
MSVVYSSSLYFFGLFDFEVEFSSRAWLKLVQGTSSNIAVFSGFSR